ncbi:hypothetical protein V6N13_064052 [Hibiscus sabdariffa]|uniref:Germin-like protein n=1 Tax=Hibiscus sabdariffa TaxID=183260 RepID=A0ABR2R1Y7_9ROSI
MLISTPLTTCLVANTVSHVDPFLNGSNCQQEDPKHAKAEDYFSGINVPGNMSNQLGSNVTAVNVEHFCHFDPDNRLITEVLYPGDVSVFHVGLIHFPVQHREKNAVALAGLSSQNPVYDNPLQMQCSDQNHTLIQMFLPCLSSWIRM